MDLSNSQEQPLAAGMVRCERWFYPLLKILHLNREKEQACSLFRPPGHPSSPVTNTESGFKGKKGILELKQSWRCSRLSQEMTVKGKTSPCSRRGMASEESGTF